MQLDLLTSSSLEVPANRSRSRESASDWMTRVATWLSSVERLFIESAPTGSSLKTSLACSHLMLDGISGRSLPPSLAIHRDLFLSHQKEAGVIQAASEVPKADMASHGACWTLNIPEHPALPEQCLKDEGVCSLSAILEAGPVPQRFYLSAKACKGILRRAANSAALTPSPDAEGRVRLRDPGVGIGSDGDPSFTLGATGVHAIAFDARQSQSMAVAYDMRGREDGAQLEGPHDTANIRAASGGSSRSYVAQGVTLYGADGTTSTADYTDVSSALRSRTPGTIENSTTTAVMTGWAVRRLTPEECEKLQGFEPGYTNIPWRGKACAPDGPRYKSLGNSFAVNVIRWIGQRIQLVSDIEAEIK